jgi:asparagine synthase (glutamine-hydrolysing)
MNIIFGIWRPGGPTVSTGELESMAVRTRRFAPNGEWFRTGPEIGLGSQAQYTHARSRVDAQPTSDAVGNVLVYDGRLDNYRELLSDLSLTGEDTPDSKIILHAYQRWGSKCFARLIGDWAIALWDSRSHALYLARDHAGTRTLHYQRDIAGTVTWATYLDSYLSTTALDVPDPVYIASYLAMLPCYMRSPYRDVRAVLPGHFLKITQKGTESRQFWTPVVQERIVYKGDDDYMAQFLHLFKQSVARRTVPGAPVLAQLSGGMDSTSIVCVADLLRTLNDPNAEPLTTLSYFNESEPDWNERPYFTLVEGKRGRCGFHVDASRYQNAFEKPSDNGALYLYPGIDQSNVTHDIDLYSIAAASGYRSILSGIGGDEFAGGNPNPAAEVADLLAAGKISSAASRAVAWCLANRMSLVELLGQSAAFIRNHMTFSHIDTTVTSIPWLTTVARQYCQTAIRELPLAPCKPFQVRPNVADACETWWYTLRTQPHLKPSEIYRYEYRYPFLDRDLIEFLLQLPSEQLSRPGRRRFVMRRALKGIVPEEILERRRKAFLLASPLNHIRESAPRLSQLIAESLLIEGGYVDKTAIQKAIDDTVRGQDLRWWGLLFRFAGLETWLQHRERPAVMRPVIQYPVCVVAPTDSVPAT